MCMDGESTTVAAPTATAQEIALQEAQLEALNMQNESVAAYGDLQEQLLPYQLASYGYTLNDDGTISEAPMDELEQAYYDNALLAVNGELPLSSLVTEDFEDQRANLEETYAQKLGANYQTSTPYIQASGELEENIAQITDSLSTGAMSTYEGLMSSYLNRTNSESAGTSSTLSGLLGTANQYGALASGYGSATQPYQYYSGLGLQANMTNAQSAASNTSSLYSGLGTLSGMAAYGLLSSKRYKKNIKYTGEEHNGLRDIEFEYTDEAIKEHGVPSGVQKGYLAEDVVEIYPEAIVFDEQGRPDKVIYEMLAGL